MRQSHAQPLCDEVLALCDQALTSEQAAHTMCLEVVKIKDDKILADRTEIQRLSAVADHSHIPHVAGTSAFWIILLLLL